MSHINVNKQVKLCVPYINDDAYIDYLIELENTVSTAERRIYEVYGAHNLEKYYGKKL